MILLAYAAALVLAVLAATSAARWVRAGGPERVARMRIATGAITAGYVLIVIGLAVFLAEDGSAAAWAITATAATGGLLYGAGLLRWYGSTAWVLRLVGWVLMFGTAAVPSHLTLLLPLVAALAVALFRTTETAGSAGAAVRSGPAAAAGEEDPETGNDDGSR